MTAPPPETRPIASERPFKLYFTSIEHNMAGKFVASLCGECSAVVHDTDKHESWHEELLLTLAAIHVG